MLTHNDLNANGMEKGWVSKPRDHFVIMFTCLGGEYLIISP